MLPCFSPPKFYHLLPPLDLISPQRQYILVHRCKGFTLQLKGDTIIIHVVGKILCTLSEWLPPFFFLLPSFLPSFLLSFHPSFHPSQHSLHPSLPPTKPVSIQPDIPGLFQAPHLPGQEWTQGQPFVQPRTQFPQGVQGSCRPVGVLLSSSSAHLVLSDTSRSPLTQWHARGSCQMALLCTFGENKGNRQAHVVFSHYEVPR